jgi:MOSC domain-containing protein YiiM
MNAVTVIDSYSTGDPSRHRPLDELEQALHALPPAPADRGRVALVVRKTEGGRRETPARVLLTPKDGIPGDAWGRAQHPKPDAQLTVMQIDVAEMLANGQPLVLFGDNLIFELNLSAASLPIGSRVRAGGALLEVTPLPHNGCNKFRTRFGDAALRLASRPELRHLNLRGIYMRVVESGEMGPGDLVKVVSRPAPPEG